MLGYVLPGGAARGSVQYGMLESLHVAGWRPKVLVGTSAGALNDVGYKFRGILGLYEIWMSIKGRSSVFGTRIDGWAPWREGLYSSDPLRKLIERALATGPTYPDIVSYVTMTNFRKGCVEYEEIHENNRNVDAILASASIPGVVDSVQDKWVDGGVLENAPLRKAIELGCDEVVVLMCNRLQLPEYTKPIEVPKKLHVAIRNLDIMMNDALKWDLAEADWHNKNNVGRQVKVHIIEPPIEYERAGSDFSKEAIDEGIRYGRQAGKEWCEKIARAA